VVQLCPLKADDVSTYLRDSAPGDVARDRWKPVTDSLSHHPSTVQVLDSPLMVTLARAVYNPRPGDSPAGLPDPAELCSPTPVDLAAVKGRLLGAFVPAVYRPKAGDRWRAAKAEKWLAFLAHHLETEVGTPDLGWWDLPKSAPPLLAKIAASISDGLVRGRPFVGMYGIACALASGLLIGVLGGPADGFLTALAAGLAIWLAGAVTGLLPGSLMTWGAVGLAAGLSGGLMGGDAGGVVAGLATGIVFAVAVCLPEKWSADTPTENQSADTPNRWLSTLAAIFVACFIAGLVAWLNFGALAGVLVAIAGAALVAACLYTGRSANAPSSALVNSLTGGLSAGTVTATVTGIPAGLVVGAAICLTMGVPMAGRTLENQGMSLVSGYSIAGMTPPANLALTRQTAFVRYWGTGLGIALIFGLAACSTVGIAVGVVAGIVEGFIAGCFCSRVEQKWPSYMMARAWLAKDGKVPWRLVAFLADARDRGVLRQVGANYQFRHIEQQKQLAETWWRFV